MRSPFVFACCLLGLAAASRAQSIPEALAPDLILHRGRIVTVDPDFSTAEAIAIKGERIVAVGSDAEVLGLSGAATELIDLEGRTVIPGLIDSHIHAFGYGLHITQHLMFSTGQRITVADMLAAIEARAKQTPPGQWIYARGPYSLDFVAEARLPNRRELDAVAPENPFFMNMQGHVGVVNSRAIELAGITRDTPNPPNGIYVKDPDTGELTGTLYEFPAFGAFLKHLPPYSLEDRTKAVRAASAALAAHGITTAVNLWTTPEELTVLQRMAHAGDLAVRWSVMLKVSPENFMGKSYPDVERELMRLGPPVKFGNDWLTVDGVKIIFDGFAEAALMHEPYLEHEFGAGWTGIKFWDAESLENVLRACAEHQVQAFVHVAGDAALGIVLEAMERVNQRTSITDRRWTLEHANVIPTDRHLGQARSLRVVVSTQQSMGWSIGKTFKRFWGDDRGAAWAPNKTWLDALGHPFVKAGSDNRPIDPFIGFWSYLAREDVDGSVGRVDQALTRPDALKLYTINGAYGIFEEDRRGSLEPGKLADLVVLSGDILSIAEERVRSIVPIMTIVGGAIRYRQSSPKAPDPTVPQPVARVAGTATR